MNLAGGEKRSETSEIIEITVASSTEEDITKTLEVYTRKRPCSAAKTISNGAMEHVSHLKPVANKLHLSGGTIDLLIGTDFVDAFVDIHTLSGEPGEPIAKRNYFGWYVLGQVNNSKIQAVEVGTLRFQDDIKKLLYQDTLGVKPTELCTCSENVLRENKFVKSLSDSTTLVDGRIQLAKVSQVEFPDAAQQLQDHAYVDDIAGSKSNSTKAKTIIKEIDTVLGKGQFQIKAWHSNCSEIDQSSGGRFTDLLGHKWDKEEEKFSFKKENVVGLLEGVSKRSCLKFLAQLWDPIGLVSPITIKFRIDLPRIMEFGLQLGQHPSREYLANMIRRTLAYVRRFIHNARKLKSAETQLLERSQFHVDEDSLDKKLVAKKGEDGLLRAHGRLEDVRCLPEELRKPIMLPQDHPFVILLLRDLHERRGHCGYNSLIHETRKRFWIIGLRRMAKTVTSKCVTCRKLWKRPLNQLLGQIPNLRVAAGFPAFSNTAMDMFGPVQIKLGRKTLKEAQVIIFTCMTSRAIHR
ncbi:uncharacterized protein [Montipora capricornis]|uniref:uncharacterized protein n=1 Tax=Montipora capricornis TaxID=246305 RepID=UPI0035F1A747